MSFQIGQDVELLINPVNPTEFYNPMDQTVMLKRVFMVVGFILFGFSIGLLIISRYIL